MVRLQCSYVKKKHITGPIISSLTILFMYIEVYYLFIAGVKCLLTLNLYIVY